MALWGSPINFNEGYKVVPEDLAWHLGAYLRNDPYMLHWIVASGPSSILEVGAGSARASVLVKRLIPQARVVALDIDPQVCEAIRELAHRCQVEIEVYCADLQELPFPDRSFDTCFSAGTMEHFPEEQVISGLKEQLRVARLVLLEVPVINWFFSKLSYQGDELVLPKTRWLSLLQSVAPLLDISFLGLPLEEVILLAALTNDPTVKLKLQKGATIAIQRDSDDQT